MIDLAALFDQVVARQASDLHLRVGQKPRLRIHGELHDAEAAPVAEASDLETLLAQSVHDAHRQQFEELGETDCACHGPRGTRYRANWFREAGGIAVSFRRIPEQIKSIIELDLPPELDELAKIRHGMVLVTGSTGSGKSSTLAALIDRINRDHVRHIITLEDPVEFIHAPIRSMIRQRSLGDDVPSFAAGVRDALRADADVLLVGELRDLETTRAALTAAETGLLVFGTLHTNDAAQTIDRLIDVFPNAEQDQVRAMLAESLAAVVSQVLLTKSDRKGRIPATELLISTPAIQALIREGRTRDIPNCLQSGREKGMWRLDDSITRLMKLGAISVDEAQESRRDRGRLDRRPLPSAT